MIFVRKAFNLEKPFDTAKYKILFNVNRLIQSCRIENDLAQVMALNQTYETN